MSPMSPPVFESQSANLPGIRFGKPLDVSCQCGRYLRTTPLVSKTVCIDKIDNKLSLPRLRLLVPNGGKIGAGGRNRPGRNLWSAALSRAVANRYQWRTIRLAVLFSGPRPQRAGRSAIMAAKTNFRGSFTAMVTPFKNGSLDEG